MMRTVSYITKSAKKSIVFAKEFLEKVIKTAPKNKPLIFYLEGELGAGKTHFVKGLALGLGVGDNITSPTFVLMKKYETTRGPLFHIDCYRINDIEDARQIGLDKILKIPNAIIAIEWAERIAEIIPKPYWEIKFKHEGENVRSMRINFKNKNGK